MLEPMMRIQRSGGGSQPRNFSRFSVFSMIFPTIVLAISACFTVTEPTERLSLVISLTHDVLHPGDTATITFVVSNSTSDTIDFLGGHCPIHYQITIPSGVVVAPRDYACIDMFQTFQLVPGDSLVADWRWTGDTGCGRSGCEMLPPGSYFVRGLVRSTKPESYRYNEVYSNRVRVKLVE